MEGSASERRQPSRAAVTRTYLGIRSRQTQITAGFRYFGNCSRCSVLVRNRLFKSITHNAVLGRCAALRCTTSTSCSWSCAAYAQPCACTACTQAACCRLLVGCAGCSPAVRILGGTSPHRPCELAVHSNFILESLFQARPHKHNTLRVVRAPVSALEEHAQRGTSARESAEGGVSRGPRVQQLSGGGWTGIRTYACENSHDRRVSSLVRQLARPRRTCRRGHVSPPSSERLRLTLSRNLPSV